MPRIAKGRPHLVSATPTVDTSTAYTAGDVVGGAIEFEHALDWATQAAIVSNVVVSDEDKKGVDLTLYLFTADPGTLTDNAAFDPSDTVITTMLKPINLNVHHAFNDNGLSISSDYTIASKGIASSQPADGDTSLWGVLVAGNSITAFSAADAVQVTIGLEQA